jgi:hypothetical protein
MMELLIKSTNDGALDRAQMMELLIKSTNDGVLDKEHK